MSFLIQRTDRFHARAHTPTVHMWPSVPSVPTGPWPRPMNVASLRNEAEAAGVTLTLFGCEVRLTAAAAPPPELLARLRAAKVALIEILRGERPICERCLHFHRDPSSRRAHRCRHGGPCLSQRQSGDCGPSGRLWEAGW